MYGARLETDRVDMAWLARNWWAIALRGVAAIVFGALALLLPATTLTGLILLFGAYALSDGLLAVMEEHRGIARVAVANVPTGENALHRVAGQIFLRQAECP